MDQKVTKVWCVWSAGDDFGVEHVARLRHQVRQHAPRGTQFCCLGDVGPPAADLVLPNSLPSWWGKIALLHQPGPALYFDLDVSIVGDLAPLLEVARSHEFAILRGFWGPESPAARMVNSSVMAWRGDVSHVANAFDHDPEGHMATYTTPERWGDQAFIRDHVRGAEFWQDLLPGQLVSYKRGVLRGEDTSDARVIVHHGKPRPWECR